MFVGIRSGEENKYALVQGDISKKWVSDIFIYTMIVLE
jgi:hypothetical protein